MLINLPDKFKELGITDFELCEIEEKDGLKSFCVSAMWNNSKFLSCRYILRKGISDTNYFRCGIEATLAVLREILVSKEGLNVK